VVIVETAWVLRVAYTFDRAAIANGIPGRHCRTPGGEPLLTISYRKYLALNSLLISSISFRPSMYG
jgi:hypothetical protein